MFGLVTINAVLVPYTSPASTIDTVPSVSSAVKKKKGHLLILARSLRLP